MTETRRVPIKTSSIGLAQFLKWSLQVQTGGEAKQLIASGGVQVNGQIEVRRSRQLVPGDQVRMEDGPILVVAGPEGEERSSCD